MNNNVDLRHEIGQLTSALKNEEFVSEILDNIHSSDDLIRFIHRYTVFNGNFAAGVTNLASAFHIRQDLFRDPTEPIAACADRSARIASHIFFAAEDEYSDRNDHSRITHRDLGQYMLKGAVEHFGYDNQAFDQAFSLNTTSSAALNTVLKGYCITGSCSDDDLFRGLGFHIASELSADQEFNAIDNYLKASNPGLIQHLMSMKTHHGQTCYRWVKLHTYVELEHLDHAIEAAVMAIKYYVGEKSQAHLQQQVINGFTEFTDTLNQFVTDILEVEVTV